MFFVNLKFVFLSTLATNAACDLHVDGLDRDAAGMNRAEVGVFEKLHQVGFGCLLQGQKRCALKSYVHQHVLRNLANQALKGQLGNEQVARRLVSTDLAEGCGARTPAMGLLDAPSRLGIRFATF